MLTVAILKNGNPLLARSARRVAPDTYRCDDGTIVKHKFEDGAIELAKKLLDTIKEERMKDPEKVFLMRARKDITFKVRNNKEMCTFMKQGEYRKCIGAATVVPVVGRFGYVYKHTIKHTTDLFDFFEATQIGGEL